ncbi:PH domain-containing protein [Pseudonocardia acaciae]|uniref:PH domain-containing protein n=1 Tax=Pseudonocardia acaciae TaxID=551276 RepID=UPI0004907A7C|nr:PH domain-containing protein [Pseudonocardia acaciae]
MAYPDELLVTGEEVLAHRHPHPKMLVMPGLVFLVTVGAAAYLAAVVSHQPWRSFGWWGIALAAAAVIGWFSVAPLLRWACTHFVLTDRRVLVREGVLTRTGFEIPMHRITSVHFRQTMFERMLGCGTLSVESASDEPLDFTDVPGVEEMYGLLYEAADGTR